MKKGFTLVEIMIVVALIAILVGIAIPNVLGVKTSGNISQAKSELAALQAALESYYMSTGAYPNKLKKLTKAVPNIIGTKLPTDPFVTDVNYGYDLSGSKVYFVVWSAGTTGLATAKVNNRGRVIESDSSCIFISSGDRDTTP